MAPTRSAGPRRTHVPVVAALALLAPILSGCGVFAQPHPDPVAGPSLAPVGSVGYVVCTNAVTPVELATRTAEAAIPLPITGTPDLGNFAIATSPDGRWAYVVTSDGTAPGPGAPSPAPTPTPATTATTTTAAATASSAGASVPGAATAGVGGENVVIPIDLVAQRASRPIPIPGQGGTHAIVVLPGGRTVLAASGSTIVPVDVSSRQVGRPLDLGAGGTIFGMALSPTSTTLYALEAGGVVPVDTANDTAGATIVTGLAVSSVYSPHGIAVTADGSTVYLVGQGPPDFGGRVLPIATATGTPGAAASFDYYGLAGPAALAVQPDGSSLWVVDSANNWINPVPLASFANPPAPVRLPTQQAGAAGSGTQHPTDIVLGPPGTGAFVVEGFDAVLPYEPVSQTFGRAIPVCAGASSMAVAPSP
jgi:DNA-binding beta-propeller fold protein YncE